MNREKNMVDEIARVAYSLYEKRGQTPGNDFADWIEAEKIVLKKYLQGKTGSEKAVKSAQPGSAQGKTRPRNSRPIL